MRRVMLEVDWYVKVLLTLIAVLLAGILVKPYVVTRPGVAQSKIADAGEEGGKWDELLRSQVGRYQLVSFPTSGVFGTIDTKTGFFMLWSGQSAAQLLWEPMEAWYVGDHLTELKKKVEEWEQEHKE